MRQPLWQKAAAFAATAHEHDYRDDEKTPYFSHPARVAMTVSQVLGCNDERTLAAAFLHDTMEYTDEGYDDLAEHFGPNVADLVVALTKNMMLPGGKREAEYLEYRRKANWGARQLKLADCYDNYADALAGMKEGRGEELKKCKEILALTKRMRTRIRKSNAPAAHSRCIAKHAS